MRRWLQSSRRLSSIMLISISKEPLCAGLFVSFLYYGQCSSVIQDCIYTLTFLSIFLLVFVSGSSSLFQRSLLLNILIKTKKILSSTLLLESIYQKIKLSPSNKTQVLTFRTLYTCPITSLHTLHLKEKKVLANNYFLKNYTETIYYFLADMDPSISSFEKPFGITPLSAYS
jgi:hypothetical protein